MSSDAEGGANDSTAGRAPLRAIGIRLTSASAEEVAGELALLVAGPVARAADLDDRLLGELDARPLDLLGGLGRGGARRGLARRLAGLRGLAAGRRSGRGRGARAAAD